MTGKVSGKSDVYGYGVLLLEMAWKRWIENKTMNLVDPKLRDTCDEMQMQRYVRVALLCVQDSARDRSNMSAVLSMLNSEIAELPWSNFPSYGARPCSGDDAYPTDCVTF
ncbi:hypothetical protein ACH5RR_016396 [Cinchona calisaya]|uniref:Uncharacterized protein n=1 Tax=Cinchona calisaya TaxID=153742 RepID=A0ABD2ZZH7_9GENT